MNQLMNRHKKIASTYPLIHDERGLSTVEYVIILVLIAAAAVGVWSSLGGIITSKVNSANGEIGKISVDGAAPGAKTDE